MLDNLCVHEDKFMKLQKLSAQLTDVFDEELQTDLMAGIADMRKQIYAVQRKLTEDQIKHELYEKDEQVSVELSR